MTRKGWIGVDLDGTLAVYDGWKGPTHIGEPIPLMVEYVKTLLAQGIEVRIFTARVGETGARGLMAIEQWCQEYLGTVLPVTDRKDFNMVFMVDDRAVVVEMNTGVFITQPPSAKAVAWHTDPANPSNPDHD
jgi:hypothetical protein